MIRVVVEFFAVLYNCLIDSMKRRAKEESKD
jgi:hypothetical protein